MKINKKILIPVFATAMGLSAIGGISGAVAWYQYNTKAEASWVGASVADGGSLLISKDGGTSWDRSIVFGDGTDQLHPVTFPGFTGSAAPSGAKRHPEYGQTDVSTWEDAELGSDYYQYTFKLKAQKIVNNAYTDIDATVKIKDFILRTAESGKSDAAKAVRVFFSSTAGNKLYSLDGGETKTAGKLDLNGDNKADYKAGYSWDDGFKDELTYGSGAYTSTALATDSEFLTIPAGGLSITLTIWWEGWHSFSSTDMSMWDPSSTGGATLQFGITFGVDRITFLAD